MLDTIGARLLIWFGPRLGVTRGRIELDQPLFMRHGCRTIVPVHSRSSLPDGPAIREVGEMMQRQGEHACGSSLA